MTLINFHLSRLWRRLWICFGLRFDLAGLELDDDEIEVELGFGRD